MLTKERFNGGLVVCVKVKVCTLVHVCVCVCVCVSESTLPDDALWQRRKNNPTPDVIRESSVVRRLSSVVRTLC